MPEKSKRDVVWYIEPMNELTSQSIIRVLVEDANMDPESHSVEVDGVLRDAYRLEGYHQVKIFIGSFRDRSRYSFRILRKRSDERNDITEVVESWGRPSRLYRVTKAKPDRLLASGAVSRGMPRKG